MRYLSPAVCLLATLALPTWAQTLSSGDVSNGTTKATNSITARKLADRAADTCNIPDQLAADGDAAAAFVRCLGTGKTQILFPPGPYVIKSMTTPVGIVLAPVAFPVDHINNLHIEASGAVFTMANGIVSGSWHIFMVYKDAKNISWHGGTFQLNPAASTGNPALVNAMCWNNVTNLTISDTVMFANGDAGSAFCGAWGFETRIVNNNAYGFVLGLDTAYDENLLVSGNYIDGSNTPVGAAAPAGFLNTSVPANYTQNVVTNVDGTPRSLRNGQSNGLQVLNNTFASNATAIQLQDVNGALVSGNVIIGPVPAKTTGNNNGILISTETNTHAEGFITQGIIITNNTITGMGNSTTSALNGGILLADGTFGLESISIIGNAIYDNCGKGIAPNGVSQTHGILIVENEFRSRGGACTQTANVDAGMVSSLGYNNLQSNGNSDTTANLPSVGAIAGTATTLGGHPRMGFAGNNITLYGSDASGNDRVIFVLPLDNSSSTLQFRAQVRDEQPLIIGGGTTGGAGTLTITPGATTTNPVVYLVAGTGGHQFSGRVLMPGLPTTCSGSPTGSLASISGVVNVCP